MPHHTAHASSAGSNNVKLQQRQLVEWEKNCILIPEVSVPEFSLPAEVTLKKNGAAVAYNQITSSLVDDWMGVYSRCLAAATFKHDNILAHHTNRRVVVSIVRTTPITTPIVAPSSSSTLSTTKFETKFGTKFGTIVVAETKSWMEPFRSIQHEFNFVLILPIVVICFSAAVIATSLARMQCLGVVQMKKRT